MAWSKFEITAATDSTTVDVSKDAGHRVGRVVEVNFEWLEIGKAFTLFNPANNTHTRTSMVQKINEATNEIIDFETINTRYILSRVH